MTFCRTADDKPDTTYLNRHVKPHVCEASRSSDVWLRLGRELLGQDGEASLNTISADCHDNVSTSCSAMFSLWLQRQPEASWRQLINALVSVKLESLASEIERLIAPSEQQQNLQQTTDLQGIATFS